MELRVECTKGKNLPKDCYVGIKIGEILKQGRYDPSRCYNFPQVEKRRNAKIDIYQHIGSCSVPVDPDSDFLQEINVQSLHSSFPGTTLKVSVQHGTNHQRDEKAKVLKRQAKDYLSQFSIEERLASAVKALLEAQAEDPIVFLCRHLGGPAPAPNTQPAHVETQTEPATSAHAETQTEPEMYAHAEETAKTADATEPLQGASTQSAMKEQGPAVAVTAEVPMELTNAAEISVLEQALLETKGARQAAVQPSQALDAQAVRARASVLIRSGAMDGSLKKALHEVKAANVSVKPDYVSTQATLPAVQPSQAIDAEAVRARASVLLRSGAVDGSLQKALHEVKAAKFPAKPDCVAPPGAPPLVQESQAMDASAVRARASVLLLSGAVDGSLKKALHEVKTAKVPAMHAVAE